MIDQAIIQTYIDASCGNRNEKSKNNLAVLLVKFFSLRPGSSLDALSRQDLIQMLAESSIMSMNTFDSFKSKIKGFLKWMCDNGYCPEELLERWQSIRFSDIDRSDFYDRYYFKDYSELCDTIQGVFGEVSSEYDTFKSAATLVWFGIDIKDLPNILKDDLNESAGYIVVPVTKRKIYLPKAAVKQLESYKNADAFVSAKFGGCTVPYADSQYLFRSYKNEQFTVAQLTNISAAANRAAADCGKIFQWNRIFLSGLYKRLLDTENQFGEIGKANYDKLRDFFGGSLSEQVLSQKYKEYQAYREYMYSRY